MEDRVRLVNRSRRGKDGVVGMRSTTLVILLLLLMVSTAVFAKSWGIGVSSEPMDISGGGFLLDSYIDWTLVTVEDMGELSLRPSFGIGPLPIHARVLFMDLLGVFRLSLESVGAYVGIGPGFMLSTSFRWSKLDAVLVAGLDDIRITDSITVYIQVKVRGAGFFVSPGVGFVFAL